MLQIHSMLFRLDHSSTIRAAPWRSHGWLLGPALLLMGWLFACLGGAPLAAQTVVTLGEDASVSTSVGEDLYVAWPAAPGDTEFRLQLVDEGGWVVAERRAVADIDGLLGMGAVASFEAIDGALWLWEMSGVVGCDDGAGVDPATYRFRRYEDAAATLAERTFEVRALKPHNDGVLATVAVSFGELGSLFFFSDGAGCPRADFGAEETIFLSVLNWEADEDSVHVFLVPELQSAPHVGMPLVELREVYQGQAQKLIAPPGDPLTIFEPVDDAFALSQEFIDVCFDGLVRQTGDDGDFSVQGPDTWIKTKPYADDDDPSLDPCNKGVRVQPWGKPIVDDGDDEED